jgi:competence ComEA-like helix-hairpin-helix protein
MDALESALARTGRALLCLALIGIASALPGPASPPTPCLAPTSAATRDGRTIAVRCDTATGPPLVGAARLLFGRGLDPNTADAASLALLPGLGSGRSQAIVRARAGGRFRRPEDLRRVPGIGAATLERLRPWLAFDPAEGTAPVDPAEAGN